jgi:hypothetical protein
MKYTLKTMSFSKHKDFYEFVTQETVIQLTFGIQYLLDDDNNVQIENSK